MDSEGGTESVERQEREREREREGEREGGRESKRKCVCARNWKLTECDGWRSEKRNWRHVIFYEQK